MEIFSLVKEPKASRPEEITDMELYTETLRIIEMHLKSYCSSTPRRSLDYFVKRVCQKEIPMNPIENRALKQVTNRQSPIKAGSRDGLLATRIKSQAYTRIESASTKRLYFIEELRMLILKTLMKKDIAGKELLKKFHLHAHLIELHLLKNCSFVEKLNTFLNTNFRLYDSDIIGHACRGNLGTIKALKPELSQAMEELSQLLLKPDMHDEISELCNRHHIDGRLKAIFCGKYNCFQDELEKYCYCLSYKVEAKEPCNEYLSILRGDFTPLLQSSSVWIQLIGAIAFSAPLSLKRYEKMFEEISLLVQPLDYQISLDYLAYSRTSEFYFNTLLNKIELNHLTVETLVSFSQRNSIDNTILLGKYLEILEERCDYEQMIRFILNHEIDVRELAPGLVAYFIENYERFRSFVPENLLKNRTVAFVKNVAELFRCSYEGLCDMLKEELFDEYVNEIIDRMVINSNIDDYLMLRCMEKILSLEKTKNIDLSATKRKIADKFIK
ncbi:hypothetical protein ENBRE01_1433 [Enteropsectra breve]|nr:hypothetical protein ENBRE01_1433 [Enteropsectra breve]